LTRAQPLSRAGSNLRAAHRRAHNIRSLAPASREKNTLLRPLLILLCAALPLCAFAGPVARFSMTGLADTGDPVELHFGDPATRDSVLIVKGEKTGSANRSFPFSYDIEPARSGALESPIIRITFGDKQQMTIACDPLSDNCHADSYATVGGVSFSMLWHINRPLPSTASTATRTH
jgi:hypothetical protein